MSGGPLLPCGSAGKMAILAVLLASCAAAGRPSSHDIPPTAARATPVGQQRPKSAASPPKSPPAPTPSPTVASPVSPNLPQAKPDVAYWATPQPVVDKMLELARVQATDVIYDLGCGDARSLVTAAKRYGARGFGFDLNPKLVAEARRNARQNGVENLVAIEQANIFDLDLSPANVVFLYLVPRIHWQLVPQLEKLRPGSRIVSHEYEIPGTLPTRIVQVPGPPDGPPETDPGGTTVMHKIYLWRMPWQRVKTDWESE